MCCINVINSLIKVSCRLYAKLTGYIFTCVVWDGSCNSMQHNFCNFNSWDSMKMNCRILCFNYSLDDVRCKKTINSDIKSQCMHICAVKFIHNTLKGLPLRILCLVKKRRQNKKKDFSLVVGHQITESFTLYFSTWTVDHNTLANRQEMEREVIRIDIHLSSEVFADF